MIRREAERASGAGLVLPSEIVAVAPDSPRVGYLQLMREGESRTLCDLPLQTHWSVRRPEEYPNYMVCRGCRAVLEQADV